MCHNQNCNVLHSVSSINTLKVKLTFSQERCSNGVQLWSQHISCECTVLSLLVMWKWNFLTLLILSASSDDSKSCASASSGAVSTELSGSPQSECPAENEMCVKTQPSLPKNAKTWEQQTWSSHGGPGPILHTSTCQRHSMTSKDYLSLQQGPSLNAGVKINRLRPDTLFSCKIGKSIQR